MYHSVKINHLLDLMTTEYRYACVVPFGSQGQCDLGFCAAGRKSWRTCGMTGEGEVCQNVGNYSSTGFNYDVQIMRDLGFLQRYGSR